MTTTRSIKKWVSLVDVEELDCAAQSPDLNPFIHTDYEPGFIAQHHESTSLIPVTRFQKAFGKSSTMRSESCYSSILMSTDLEEDTQKP